VLFTANDAYLRDFKIVVPRDCVCSIKPEDNEYALKQMQDVLKADIRASSEIELAELKMQKASKNEEGKSDAANQQQTATAKGGYSK
jgi:hypothetical protein